MNGWWTKEETLASEKDSDRRYWFFDDPVNVISFDAWQAVFSLHENATACF